MESRNFMSIEFHNNISIPKLILRPLNRYLNPQKTFSITDNNNNNKILNLKTTFGNFFLKSENDRYKTIFSYSKDKNSNISNRNTYYKTNNFSPHSTVSFFSSRKSIKEKNKNEKNFRNKNSPLSLKKIEFINNKEKTNLNGNNRVNNIKFIVVGNKAPPKKELKTKNNNKTHNIEISGQNIIGHTYYNEKKSNNQINNSKKKDTIIHKRDVSTSIDFLWNPNYKSTKKIKSKTINKEKDKKKNKKFLKHKDINVKPLEDYDEKVSENNYDNRNNNSNILSFNTNPNKKIIVQLKTRKNSDNKEIIIKEINVVKNNVEKKINKKNIINKYGLDADFDKFDPITLKSNKNLTKDFLRKKEKEKILLEKLFENEKIKEVISKFPNNSDKESKIKEESKTLNENEKNNIRPKNFWKNRTKLIKLFKQYSLKKFNNLFKEFFNREYLKPSEYINYIADKIIADIDSFRNKRYKDIYDEIIDDNFSGYMNSLETKDSNKIRHSIRNLFSKNSNRQGKIHEFHSQLKLNINNDNNLKNSKSNTIIKNINIQTPNNNEKIEFKPDNKPLLTKMIQSQTQKNMNEFDNQKNTNNEKKSFRNKLLGDGENKKNKKNKKKFKSYSKQNKINKTNKIAQTDKNKENSIDKNDIEKGEDEEIIERENNETENKEKIKDIIEEEKEKLNYKKNRFKKDKKKTFIKRTNKFRFTDFVKKNKKILEEKENKKDNEEKNISSEKEDKTKKLDELYGLNEYDIQDDLIILNEFDKINIENDLKSKLIENVKQVIDLIKKEPKTRTDYIKLHVCQKRIKYIIKKMSEKDTKKNITNKPKKDLSFPEKLEERKKLYKLMRVVENKIREELEKTDSIEYEEESNSSSDNENYFSNNIYEFPPIEEKEVEPKRKVSIFDSPRKRQRELIYDNLYLYQNDEEDNNNNVEIRKEIYDVLNTNKSEETSPEKLTDREEASKSPMRFYIKRRKFKKNKKNIILKKLKEDEEIKDDKNNKITLDMKMNNFFEKIKKLKRENVVEIDYDKILNELFSKQGENYYEESMIKEIRLLNFFKYFQTSRKLDLVGKKYFRNKYTFNSPLYFTKSK